jgi:hypothetical protein
MALEKPKTGVADGPVKSELDAAIDRSSPSSNPPKNSLRDRIGEPTSRVTFGTIRHTAFAQNLAHH